MLSSQVSRELDGEGLAEGSLGRLGDDLFLFSESWLEHSPNVVLS